MEISRQIQTEGSKNFLLIMFEVAGEVEVVLDLLHRFVSVCHFFRTPLWDFPKETSTMNLQITFAGQTKRSEICPQVQGLKIVHWW